MNVYRTLNKGHIRQKNVGRRMDPLKQSRRLFLILLPPFFCLFQSLFAADQRPNEVVGAEMMKPNPDYDPNVKPAKKKKRKEAAE